MTVWAWGDFPEPVAGIAACRGSRKESGKRRDKWQVHAGLVFSRHVSGTVAADGGGMVVITVRVFPCVGMKDVPALSGQGTFQFREPVSGRKRATGQPFSYKKRPDENPARELLLLVCQGGN